MEHNEDDAASSYREYESVDYSESFNEFESPAGLSHDDAVMNDEQGHLKRKACGDTTEVDQAIVPTISHANKRVTGSNIVAGATGLIGETLKAMAAGITSPNTNSNGDPFLPDDVASGDI